MRFLSPSLVVGLLLSLALLLLGSVKLLLGQPDGAAAFLGALLVGAWVGGHVFYYGRQAQRADWLQRHGRLVAAHSPRLEESSWRGSNGTRYFYLHCRWTDPTTGLAHSFKSRRLDLPAALPLPAGATVPVFLDPKNPTRYYVDTSFLPGT